MVSEVSEENHVDREISCIAFRLRRLARLATRYYERELKGTGLTVQQFSMINILGTRGPINAGDLANILDLEKSTLSRNAMVLKKLGFIALAFDEMGRAPLTLTPKGEKILARAMPKWRKAQAAAHQAIGDDGWTMLDRMVTALEFK